MREDRSESTISSCEYPNIRTNSRFARTPRPRPSTSTTELQPQLVSCCRDSSLAYKVRRAARSRPIFGTFPEDMALSFAPNCLICSS